jgi:hypothetical protein
MKFGRVRRAYLITLLISKVMQRQGQKMYECVGLVEWQREEKNRVFEQKPLPGTVSPPKSQRLPRDGTCFVD